MLKQRGHGWPLLVFLSTLTLSQGTWAETEVILELTQELGYNSRPAKPGQGFNRPADLALSKDGKQLYVADSGNGLVQLLASRTLRYQKSIGKAQLKAPQYLHEGRFKQLMVSDNKNRQVSFFDNKQILARYVANLAPAPLQPTGVAENSQGKIYLADAQQHSVSIYSTAQRRKIKTVGGMGSQAGQFRNPTDLIINQGKLFVADTGNDRIQILDLNLKPLQIIGPPQLRIDAPNSIAMDEKGWLYIVSNKQNQVVVLNNHFEEMARIGKRITGSKNNRLNNPQGVAARNNQIWISDTGNHRLLHYRLRIVEKEKK